MARWITIGAAAALLATPALAAPGLGASSWSASSESTAREIEQDGASLVDLLLGLYGVSLDRQVATKPAKTSHEPSDKAYQCDQEKKAAEEQKLAEAKKPRATGPEPVYLAF